MKSYLKFLSRNKLYTAIEAAGLAVSLAFVILIGSYVVQQYEVAHESPQVEAESNLGALRSGLPGNTRNSIETIEGMNHMFQHCQTGSPNEYREIEETFAPEVLEKLVRWISGQ